MTMADLSPITAVILAAIGGGIGATLAAALIFRATRLALHTEIANLTRGLDLREVEIVTTVEIEAEDFKGRSAVKWTGSEIEAVVVERWLEQRGLIAQPRGVDLTPTKTKA
jgi:hypothetical protein